ncbi:MAG: response regulator transcription factor [Saprospiraceae bacterium]|nr:response regulator transcription factor [Saprospiraceae bacterium]
MKNISVAIIEDDQDIRQLLQLIIDKSPGFSCLHAYESCEDGIPTLLEFPPQIILMDIDLPGMNGIEGIKTIRQHNQNIIILMLTIHTESDVIFDCLCAGANGYLVKGIAPTQLLNSIIEASNGGAPMTPKIASKVVQFFHRTQNHGLTNRELQVLKLLTEGENYSTIGEQLFISKNTVKGHIKNIYSKLHVNSRAEAVLKAYQTKII